MTVIVCGYLVGQLLLLSLRHTSSVSPLSSKQETPSPAASSPLETLHGFTEKSRFHMSEIIYFPSVMENFENSTDSGVFMN